MFSSDRILITVLRRVNKMLFDKISRPLKTVQVRLLRKNKITITVIKRGI